MILRNAATPHRVLFPIIVIALAGCATTPLGPTVQVMPGRGKSFETFQSDQSSCKSYAAGQVSGQADAANQRAAGGAVLTTLLGAGTGAIVGGAVGDAGTGAAVGAAAGVAAGTGYGAAASSNDQLNIQQQYDNAFAQCMYAKGEQVPGFAPAVATASAPAAVPDPLVRSTQRELIRLGYLKDTADGFIGPKTRSAISNFEQAAGLAVVGSPSPMVLARLQSTPTNPPAALGPTATAPSNWVAPTGAPAATPAAAAAPAPASGWVAPAKTP
jgi:hypothetical protein